jgi:small GTP-binding protein
MILEKINILFQSLIESLREQLYSVFLMDSNKEIICRLDNDKNTDVNIDNGIEKVINSKLINHFLKEENAGFNIFTYNLEEFGIIFSESGPNRLLIFVFPSEFNSNFYFPYVFLISEKIVRINLKKNVSNVIPSFEQISEDISIQPQFQKIELDKGGTYSVKIVLGGDSAVGKSTLVEQFVNKKFKQDFKSTLGINIMFKKVKFPKLKSGFDFSIYDLGGQITYKEVRKTYCRGAAAGFLVFDVTNPQSFSNLKTWYNEFIEAEPDILLIMVGNKTDLEEDRFISFEQANQMAKELNLQYIETCALNKDLVDEAFSTLGLAYIMKKIQLKQKKVEIKSGWRF